MRPSTHARSGAIARLHRCRHASSAALCCPGDRLRPCATLRCFGCWLHSRVQLPAPAPRAWTWGPLLPHVQGAMLDQPLSAPGSRIPSPLPAVQAHQHSPGQASVQLVSSSQPVPAMVAPPVTGPTGGKSGAAGAVQLPSSPRIQHPYGPAPGEYTVNTWFAQPRTVLPPGKQAAANTCAVHDSQWASDGEQVNAENEQTQVNVSPGRSTGARSCISRHLTELRFHARAALFTCKPSSTAVELEGE